MSVGFDFASDAFGSRQLAPLDVRQLTHTAEWDEAAAAKMRVASVSTPPDPAPVVIPGQPAVCGACLHRHAHLRATDPRGGHGPCDVCGRVRWRVAVEVQGVQEARARRVASEDDRKDP